MRAHSTDNKADANRTFLNTNRSLPGHSYLAVPADTETVGLDEHQPVRIFIIEDSLVVRQLLVEQLAEIPGVNVLGYADSEQSAINQLQRLVCDIVILDIHLRPGSGLEVLRRLATMPEQNRQPQIRIVFSNYVEDEYRKLAQRYGATHFLDKVSDLPALLNLVAERAKRPSSHA